ncbi:MAG: CNP1-like family protein [Burkholderiales bacterium]|nr:CNP1-like family protein [Burkholderiales bacterium]PZN05711.1 MAG: hypothetical protein DIU74_01730 [Pseudomonadota bacterium]
MRKRLFFLAALLATAAQAQIPLFDHDPRGRVPEEFEYAQERPVEFPALPAADKLLPFDPGRPTSMRFYVDGDSVSVGEDGVVRYTLVVEGDAGTRNIMYEGVRCKTAERKTYGFGQPDGSWSRARDPQWEQYAYDVPRRTLYVNFLCPLKGPIRTAEEGVQALREGAHPLVRQFQSTN